MWVLLSGLRGARLTTRGPHIIDMGWVLVWGTSCHLLKSSPVEREFNPEIAFSEKHTFLDFRELMFVLADACLCWY